ncbi:MAG: hypothetical protein KC478_02950 [Bacteriovoracaceae bacterium]|nr:hypothetical protein [Bacteriovoracaceae bacterium]
MEDLRSILSSHHNKSKAHATKEPVEDAKASASVIPDLFFDEILIQYKLSRIEIILMMHLYRLTWCRPNLHKKYGIAPIISYKDSSESMGVTVEIFQQTLRRLESFGFIETIRAGQYFVRKYFTEENDKKYGQSYDNFL